MKKKATVCYIIIIMIFIVRAPYIESCAGKPRPFSIGRRRSIHRVVHFVYDSHDFIHRVKCLCRKRFAPVNSRDNHLDGGAVGGLIRQPKNAIARARQLCFHSPGASLHALRLSLHQAISKRKEKKKRNKNRNNKTPQTAHT